MDTPTDLRADTRWLLMIQMNSFTNLVRDLKEEAQRIPYMNERGETQTEVALVDVQGEEITRKIFEYEVPVLHFSERIFCVNVCCPLLGTVRRPPFFSPFSSSTGIRGF